MTFFSSSSSSEHLLRGFVKKGERKQEKKKREGKTGETRSESRCGEEREARWEAVCSDRTGTRALRKASSLPAPKAPL